MLHLWNPWKVYEGGVALRTHVTHVAPQKGKSSIIALVCVSQDIESNGTHLIFVKISANATGPKQPDRDVSTKTKEVNRPRCLSG